jgi:hypothetical protein
MKSRSLFVVPMPKSNELLHVRLRAVGDHAGPALDVFCDSPEEIESAYKRFSEGGTLLMPLNRNPFSEEFAVSGQLNLPTRN